MCVPVTTITPDGHMRCDRRGPLTHTAEAVDIPHDRVYNNG
jgi:hypothetical protein